MALEEFLLQNSLRKVRFFEKTFLLANINMELILKMLFLSLSNANFQFSARKFTYKSYISNEALAIFRQVKLIQKYKFTKTAFDKNTETFIIGIFVIKAILLKMLLHFFHIFWLATYQQDKAITKILLEFFKLC